MNEVANLVVNNKTDKEIAADLRQRLTAALEPVMAILTEAGKNDMAVNFNIGSDAAKRATLTSLTIVKNL